MSLWSCSEGFIDTSASLPFFSLCDKTGTCVVRKNNKQNNTSSDDMLSFRMRHSNNSHILTCFSFSLLLFLFLFWLQTKQRLWCTENSICPCLVRWMTEWHFQTNLTNSKSVRMFTCAWPRWARIVECVNHEAIRRKMPWDVFIQVLGRQGRASVTLVRSDGPVF